VRNLVGCHYFVIFVISWLHGNRKQFFARFWFHNTSNQLKFKKIQFYDAIFALEHVIKIKSLMIIGHRMNKNSGSQPRAN